MALIWKSFDFDRKTIHFSPPLYGMNVCTPHANCTASSQYCGLCSVLTKLMWWLLGFPSETQLSLISSTAGSGSAVLKGQQEKPDGTDGCCFGLHWISKYLLQCAVQQLSFDDISNTSWLHRDFILDVWNICLSLRKSATKMSCVKTS